MGAILLNRDRRRGEGELDFERRYWSWPAILSMWLHFLYFLFTIFGLLLGLTVGKEKLRSSNVRGDLDNWVFDVDRGLECS